MVRRWVVSNVSKCGTTRQTLAWQWSSGGGCRLCHEWRTNRLIDLARQISKEPNAREYDRLNGVNRWASLDFFAMALNKNGVSAKSMTGGQVAIRTDDSHAPKPVFNISMIVSFVLHSMLAWSLWWRVSKGGWQRWYQYLRSGGSGHHWGCTGCCLYLPMNVKSIPMSTACILLTHVTPKTKNYQKSPLKKC